MTELCDVSAIIPVYNDRDSLGRAVPAAIDTLSRITPHFELLIAEDGSTDGSTELARKFEREDSRIRLLHNDMRQGRGKALGNAIQSSRGKIVCYFDVDLATDMNHIIQLVEGVRQGCDITTGSRLLPGSMIVRSGNREIASRGYNFLVRLILRSRIHDHQCGFKAFNRERILSILPRVRSSHWFWDTEILVRGQRGGFRVKEFPVRWTEGQGTTVRRKDITEMGTAILRLWWQIHVSEG